MPTLSAEQQGFLQSLSELTYCNPFEPVRIELERRVLGGDHQSESIDAWSRTESGSRLERPNVVRINERATSLAEQLLDRQKSDGPLTGAGARLYGDLVTYVLYYRHVAGMPEGQLEPDCKDESVKALWRGFRDERDRLLAPLRVADRRQLAGAEHLFASLHQVRRAFYWIFGCFIGESAPATKLRAAVWQSIFTHDLRRYERTLYDRMGNFTTLVTGPSGTGKELVAQAVGRSQYRAFDAKAEGFVGEGDALFALNLSALSPTLIESELFGHKRGAFTGAGADRVGWLERCPRHGAVFLDEIGELDAAIQVKLLRVAQSRDYSRLGESTARHFEGKLLAATNRDLAEEMRAGRFREDLYYRLCSDRVVVPSLREQIAAGPGVLASLVRFLAGRLLGDADDSEAEDLTGEVMACIDRDLPAGYAWPGNIRELDQCVRGVLLRRGYQPPAMRAPDERPDWLTRAEAGELSADELLSAYCRHVHGRQGGYEQAARVLGLDRRTVKSRVTGGG